MFFYRVGYWTHDGAAAVELSHTRWYGRAEFDALVYAAIAELLRREPEKRAHFPFAWLYDQVADWLVERHGFRRLEYAAEFEIYGSGSLWEGDEDLPDLDKLRRYLREQGLAEPRDS